MTKKAILLLLLFLIFPIAVLALTQDYGLLDILSNYRKSATSSTDQIPDNTINTLDASAAMSNIKATPTPYPQSAVKVLILDFNPIIENRGGVRLRELKAWTNPWILDAKYISDVKSLSNNQLIYNIVSRIDNIDGYLAKTDGFRYTDETYLDVIEGRTIEHRPDIINYQLLIDAFDLCGRLNRGEIDEVWLWGGPWFGFYEAVMAGPGAFSTNAPPLTGTTCTRKLNIMGFSYERGVAEMLEDLGHRVEGTMQQIYPGADPRYILNTSNPWGKFVGACGWMHTTPTSSTNGSYDYTNTRFVNTTCNDWLNYPNLTGNTETLNCSAWGCTNYGFKIWWFSRFPKADGKTNNVWNNWWKYIINYDAAISS